MNPVLQKDLLGLLRLKRVAAVQILFVAVLAVMVLGSWPQGGVLEGSAQIGSSGVVGSADRFLLGLTLGQIVLLILFVPGIAAVAVSGEREQNTLEMLYASRLKPREIIAGKVGVAVGYPLLLMLMALPFVALLNWRGDVRVNDLVWSYVVLLVTAVFLAVVSLAVSAWAKQSATALVISYIVVPAAIMLDNAQGSTAQLLHYARALSPVAAALSLLQPQSNFAAAERGMTPIWQIYIPLASIVIAGCFVALAAKLSRAPSSSDAFGAAGAAAAFSVGVLGEPGKSPAGFNAFAIYDSPYEDHTTKLEALKALGNLPDRAAADRLKQIAESDPTPDRRWIAHWSYERCAATQVPYSPPVERSQPQVTITDLSP